MAAFHHLDDAFPNQIGRGERIDTLTPKLYRTLGYIAALGAKQIGNRLQRGGFSRAVGTEQGNDALLGHFE